MRSLKNCIRLVPVLAILNLTSCEKECGDGTIQHEPKQHDLVYFQYESTNYAWGFTHSGWYIDEAGEFKYYSQPQDLIEPDSLGYIAKADLMSNLSKADSVIYHVSILELENQTDLIKEVNQSSFSDLLHVGADIGKLDLYCFRWEASLSKYKRISLATSGDIEQHNLDPEARELTAWLIAEGERTGSFYWP